MRVALIYNASNSVLILGLSAIGGRRLHFLKVAIIVICLTATLLFTAQGQDSSLHFTQPPEGYRYPEWYEFGGGADESPDMMLLFMYSQVWQAFGYLASDSPIKESASRSGQGLNPLSSMENPLSIKNPYASIPSFSAGQDYPQEITVWHKRDLLWPTKLERIDVEAGVGNYKGKDFSGKEAEATVVFESSGDVKINIHIAENGYYGTYVGKLNGNIVEGEYEPSAGFGPIDYFKAEWL
jgi:hypothetical protein